MNRQRFVSLKSPGYSIRNVHIPGVLSATSCDPPHGIADVVGDQQTAASILRHAHRRAV
jgi:hypothetical protein